MPVVFFHQNYVRGVQGGIERYLSTLLDRAGPSALLVTEATSQDTATSWRYVDVPLPLPGILPKWLSYTLGVILRASTIRRAVSNLGQCTLEFSRPEYLLFSWMFKGTKVFTLHGTGPAPSERVKFWLHYVTCSMLPRFADIVQIVGRDLRGLPQSARSQMPTRIRHIDAWYDEVFRVSPFPDVNGPLRVFFAGRLAPMKNPELLFKIIQTANRRGHKFEFVYFGADEEKIPPGPLRQHFRSAGLLNAPQLSKAIANCHVGILCSAYGEGSPFIVVEALACGRGYILPPLKGLIDAYKNCNGINFATEYSVDAFIEALLRFQSSLETGLSPESIALDVSDRSTQVLTRQILQRLEEDCK
jgi:glycosyltransferase involved in cell wall biosynthesis